jgi:hypothetical protein
VTRTQWFGFDDDEAPPEPAFVDATVHRFAFDHIVAPPDRLRLLEETDGEVLAVLLSVDPSPPHARYEVHFSVYRDDDETVVDVARVVKV